MFRKMKDDFDVPPTNSAEMAKAQVRMNVGVTIFVATQAFLVKVGLEERGNREACSRRAMYRTMLTGQQIVGTVFDHDIPPLSYTTMHCQ